MFNKLREKLKTWTQGLIKKAVVEEVQEVSKKEKAKKPAKEKTKAKEIKNIDVPLEFNAGIQQYQPD